MDAAAHLRSVACVASTLYADAQHSHNAIIFGLFQFHLFKEITRVGAYAGSEIHISHAGDHICVVYKFYGQMDT